jgi:solute carrier family 12 (sodium/potassium/chloride transporter), member 2
LARDSVIPRIIGKGFGTRQDPHIATGIAFLFGLSGILLGGLNIIAPVLSMFFLASYGILNLSAAFEGLVGSVYWRPRFNVYWGISAVGALACFAAMFMINAGATFITLIFSLIIYLAMHKREINTHWGDMRYGILMLILQHVLYKLAEKAPDERSWKPNILVFSGLPQTRWHLIELAEALSHGKGLLTVGAVFSDELAEGDRMINASQTITKYLSERSVPALVKVQKAADQYKGIETLIKTYGFGPIVPNTILMGQPREGNVSLEYARLVKLIYASKRNLIICSNCTSDDIDTPRRLDVWWNRKSSNAGLLLAIAHLLSTSPKWSNSKMILRTIIGKHEEPSEAQLHLSQHIKQGRLVANVSVHIQEEVPVFETISNVSSQADYIFLGVRPPEEEESDQDDLVYFQKLLENVQKLPKAILVLAAENIEFERMFW